MVAKSWNDLARAGAKWVASPRFARANVVRESVRLFDGGTEEDAKRVTLYRDNHAWCPYCQKVWLWLEERRVSYRIQKITMFCYGEKEEWYKKIIRSGMLPALELDGRLITESDDILYALEATFGPLVNGEGLDDPAVFELRQLERALFSSWCGWLCQPHRSARSEEDSQRAFVQVAQHVEAKLKATPGPYFLERCGTADVIFTPYIERMAASLVYYKGFDMKTEHPTIGAWFKAMETRETYLATQSDYHTHVHDLPPQMGGCYSNNSRAAAECAARIDGGDLRGASDTEALHEEPEDAALEALARVVKHHETLAEINPDANKARFDTALRQALTLLVSAPGGEEAEAPPAGSATGLRYLRDRVNCPRDMSLFAARRFRAALEAIAARDDAATGGAAAQPPQIPLRHRRDQDLQPFRRQMNSCI